ncbi:hypothetical protein [Aquipuribacter nitratireducens]|uniref:Uncharacterized protein n=1 Tax=Aquipuribacter nitratireducens TaxID=650104 RepID=A0ABW0GT68_9MICO
MAHPTDGTLRRLVDEPHGVSDTERDHVVACATCAAALGSVRDDAARAALLLDDPAVGRHEDDVDAAWQRLSTALAHDVAPVTALPRGAVPARRRWRRALRSPAAALVTTAAVLAGAGAAAAGDWLPIFRTERVAAPDATRAELVTLPEPEDLDAYGTLEVLAPPEVREVDGAAAAEAATGLAVPVVHDLPRGVTGSPRLLVAGQVSAEFTFSEEEAARTAAELGAALEPVPGGLDGTRFRLVAGPGHASVWSEARGVPALVVGRAVAPTAFSTGVPLEEAVEFLASLPGLPPGTARTLTEFAGDGATLPLPIGTDEATTTTADVGGVDATVVTARDGTAAGVVWVEDGVVTAVAGSLGGDEVLAVARGLRDR